MPFVIIRNDITNMAVDAIVNTANPRPVIGSGTDAVIHPKAGPQLLKARQRIGEIACGDAAVTPAYDLPAKYVIHTVSPVWVDGNQGEEQLLRSCYDASLRLALKKKCQTVAFPLLASGNCGFPKDKALQIAISAFRAFLLEQEMQIYLVVFDQTAYRMSEKLFCGVASYIDAHYVGICRQTVTENSSLIPNRNSEVCWSKKEIRPLPCRPVNSDIQGEKDLNRFLKQKDIGFIEALKDLIEKSGLKNATVYKRANMSKQHFSKLMNSPNANPTKPTAIALALALELDLAQTKELIGRAGYALTNSSIFDLIIQYYIAQRNYNIIEINITLYEFDQSLLGS